MSRKDGSGSTIGEGGERVALGAPQTEEEVEFRKSLDLAEHRACGIGQIIAQQGRFCSSVPAHGQVLTKKFP